MCPTSEQYETVCKGEFASKLPSELTPSQRLLILDTWRRSGLPAGDFASMVGLSKHTLYSWKKKFTQEGPAGLMAQPKGGDHPVQLLGDDGIVPIPLCPVFRQVLMKLAAGDVREHGLEGRQADARPEDFEVLGQAEAFEYIGVPSGPSQEGHGGDGIPAPTDPTTEGPGMYAQAPPCVLRTVAGQQRDYLRNSCRRGHVAPGRPRRRIFHHGNPRLARVERQLAKGKTIMAMELKLAFRLVSNRMRVLHHTVTHVMSIASEEALLRSAPNGWLTRYIPCTWGARQDAYAWDRGDWHVDGQEDCRRFLEEAAGIGRVIAGLGDDVPERWKELLPGTMAQALGSTSGLYLADYWMLIVHSLAWNGRLPYRCAIEFAVGDEVGRAPFCLISQLPVDVVQASADALTLLMETASELHLATANTHASVAPQAVASRHFRHMLQEGRAGTAVVELADSRGQLSASVGLQDPPQVEDDDQWLTVTQAAEMLMDVVSGIDLPKARARVSKAANSQEFKTNGQKGARRRIAVDSFNTWRFKQRERDLDAADE